MLDDMKLVFREIDCGGVDWSQLAQGSVGSVQRLAFVNGNS
jgi:hypothetical protein